MSSDLILQTADLGKTFKLYDRPDNVFWQLLFDKLSFFLPKKRANLAKEFVALQNVHFDLERGSSLGIIGRNGSGKSTLLQMLCGTLKPSSGHVRLNGRVAGLLELGSGFHPDFTGRQNVQLNARLLGLSSQQVEERFQQIVDFSDIGEHIDLPLKTYSTGMSMRLAFSVIAHVDADLLVIDEALAVGDGVFSQKCYRFFEKFRARNGSSILVSHDLTSVRILCDKVLWLDNGVVRAYGDTNEICDAYQNLLIDQLEAGERPSSSKAHQDNEKATNQQGGSSRLVEIGKTAIGTEKKHRPNIISIDSAYSLDVESGRGGLKPTKVGFYDSLGQEIRQWKGREKVELRLEFVLEDGISQPIIGFYVQNKQGLQIFGHNTYGYLPEGFGLVAGKTYRVSFNFQFPLLSAGYYFLSAAVSSGTQADHSVLAWMTHIVGFRSDYADPGLGIFGTPLEKITISEIADSAVITTP